MASLRIPTALLTISDFIKQYNIMAPRNLCNSLGNYKLTDLRKEVIRDFYEEMRHSPRLDGRGNLSEKSVEGLHNTLGGIEVSQVQTPV